MWNYKPLLACFHPTILAKFDARELNYSARDNKEIKPGQNSSVLFCLNVLWTTVIPYLLFDVHIFDDFSTGSIWYIK